MLIRHQAHPSKPRILVLDKASRPRELLHRPPFTIIASVPLHCTLTASEAFNRYSIPILCCRNPSPRQAPFTARRILLSTPHVSSNVLLHPSNSTPQVNFHSHIRNHGTQKLTFAVRPFRRSPYSPPSNARSRSMEPGILLKAKYC